MALVPESVNRSMITSSEWIANRFQCARCSNSTRSSRVVSRIGSTVLMRKGSMIVFMGTPAGGRAYGVGCRREIGDNRKRPQ